MLSRFFVDRPIFAWVVAIVIMLAGLLSIFNLPVSQYPRIAPPQVTVSATYPGASAETMSRTVTQIIEQPFVHEFHVGLHGPHDDYAHL